VANGTITSLGSQLAALATAQEQLAHEKQESEELQKTLQDTLKGTVNPK
jgi:hypothetical protein